MGLSFTIATGPRQRSHSQTRVPQNSRSHFTLSDSILPQPGGSGPHVYNPQEQGGPVVLQGTRFPICRPLRLSGLRWWYSILPPHGMRAHVKVTLGFAVYRRSVRLSVKPLETHAQRSFFKLRPYGNSPYVTSSQEQMGLSLMNMLGLSSSVYITLIEC
jgi:hypothetical protein